MEYYEKYSILYPNQISRNIEENIQKLNEHLSNNQNNDIPRSNQNAIDYPLESENQNINNPNNIQQNNLNSEIPEASQINNTQLKNVPEINNQNHATNW